MNRRIMLAAAATLGSLAVAAPARAQIANLPPTEASQTGWTFDLAPYAWLPTISTTYGYNTLRGNNVTNTINAGIGDYLTKLNFALFGGAEARYDRFTLMTDLVYANASLTSSQSHFSTLNVGPGPIYIPREQQLYTGTRLAATVWTLGGGYTVLQGDWGNVDAVAGMRLLFFGSTTNYTLTADFLLPDRTVGLSRTGSLNLGTTKPEGFGGVAGRINIPNSAFFLPFYADVGGGAVPLTWQIYGGVGWQAADFVDLSVGYRYLAFSNGNQTGIEKLNLGGVILAANFHF